MLANCVLFGWFVCKFERRGVSPRFGFFNANPQGKVAVYAQNTPKSINMFTKITSMHIDGFKAYSFLGYMLG